MKKRIAGALLAAVMLLSSFPAYAFEDEGVPVPGDIPETAAGEWLEEEIQQPMQDGAEETAEIFTGSSYFSAYENIAPMAVITSSGNNASEHAKWVNGSYSDVGIIRSGTMTGTVFAQFEFEKPAVVDGVEIAFESMNPDRNNFVFHYDILYSIPGEPDWTVLVTGAQATRTDPVRQHELPAATEVSMVRMELTEIERTGGDPWPAMAEFKIFGEFPEIEVENVAPAAFITSTGNNGTEHAKWVNNNYNDVGIMNAASFTGPVFAQFDYNGDAYITSFEIAFERTNPDNYGFVFHYDIMAAKFGETQWETLVEDGTATRTDPIRMHELETPDAYGSVRVVLTAIEKTGGDPWPAMAEFKIFGRMPQEVINPDPDNIAFGKPVHANSGLETAKNAVDGSNITPWRTSLYPAYLDIDLEENYFLESVAVYTPAAGYTQYTIYTSMDGRDYTLLADKDAQEPGGADGDIFAAEGREARFVRLYVTYYSASSAAVVNEIKLRGTPSGSPVVYAPEVHVPDFKDSMYDVAVTNTDAVEAVQGIVARNLGAQYVSWFDFVIAPNSVHPDYDYYEISNGGSTVRILANDGVSLAMGLNHYMKYFLNVHISQVGNQVNMPAAPVRVSEPVRRETPYKIRYAYNYCTMSYTMAFWGEEEWQQELDWLALNGVNVVLDITAQEEVWRRFLTELGYNHKEIKDFIAGPAYYAWAYMANLSGFGGPLHDSWFARRTELARKNQLFMRKLGMTPILQGYSGMVPNDILAHDETLDANNVITQGNWQGYVRPDMLRTVSESYRTYAELFYECQEAVYGGYSNYYATDPFHEGGRIGDMSYGDVSKGVMEAILNYNREGIWIIQSWGANPTSSFINGLQGYQEHALILDLYAEASPRWENTSSYGGREFGSTPWIYCMLSNFGGRMGLYGHIDNFVKEIPRASKEASYLKGIGITPEASQTNPVLFDLFFETIWRPDPDNIEAIDLQTWFKDYTTRRYGAESEAAYHAMLLLNETAYNPANNTRGQGAAESVINARPAYSISAASTWGNAVIGYDKETFEQAAMYLLEDYETLQYSDAYLYDVADVLKQLLSNTAQEYHKDLVRAYNNGDAQGFAAKAERYLKLIDMVDDVLGTREEFLLGTWVSSAKRLGAETDDFTQRLYEYNAKALVTTWGSINHAEGGALRDYSNRQWAGLTKDYYKPRWEIWLRDRALELEGGPVVSTYSWFPMEWAFARGDATYPVTANELDLKLLADEIFEKYTLGNMEKPPESDDTNDIPLEGMTYASGSHQNGEDITKAFDNNYDTLWHTLWAGAPRQDHWAVINLPYSQTVNGLRYLPRQSGTNGIVTGYEIQISKDGGQTYKTVAQGAWLRDSDWKMVTFEPVDMVTNVKFISTQSYTSDGTLYTSAAEIRLTRPAAIVDKSVLEATILQAESLPETLYTPESFSALQLVLNTAKEIYEAEGVTQEDVDTVIQALVNAMEALVVYVPVTGVKINSAAITVIAKNNIIKLTAAVTPADATNTGVIWTSSSNNIATVDENGMVRAVSPGMITITAQTEDGGYKSQIILRVTM